MNALTQIATGKEVGVGLYTIPMAAQLVAAHQNKVRSWISGYPSSDAAPIIQRDLPNIGGRPVMSFLDLVEAAFIRHFRSIGYTAQTIRKVAEKLRARHSVKHPFAMDTRFRADGRQIFEETVDDEGERRLLNLMNDNFEMGPVVERSLFHQIFYVEDLARRWTPIAEVPAVIVDPAISLGKPVVATCGIPTRTLSNDFGLYGSLDDVAEEYEIAPEDVAAAVEFERILKSRLLH